VTTVATGDEWLADTLAVGLVTVGTFGAELVAVTPLAAVLGETVMTFETAIAVLTSDAGFAVALTGFGGADGVYGTQFVTFAGRAVEFNVAKTGSATIALGSGEVGLAFALTSFGVALSVEGTTRVALACSTITNLGIAPVIGKALVALPAGGVAQTVSTLTRQVITVAFHCGVGVRTAVTGSTESAGNHRVAVPAIGANLTPLASITFGTLQTEVAILCRRFGAAGR